MMKMMKMMEMMKMMKMIRRRGEGRVGGQGEPRLYQHLHRSVISPAQTQLFLFSQAQQPWSRKHKWGLDIKTFLLIAYTPPKEKKDY